MKQIFQWAAFVATSAWAGHFMDLRPGIKYTYKSMDRQKVVMVDSVMREQVDSVCLNSMSALCKKIQIAPLARYYLDMNDKMVLDTTWALHTETKEQPQTWWTPTWNGGGAAANFELVAPYGLGEGRRLAKTVLAEDSLGAGGMASDRLPGYRFDDTTSNYRFAWMKQDGHEIRLHHYNSGNCWKKYKIAGVVGVGVVSVDYQLPLAADCMGALAVDDPDSYFNPQMQSYYLASISLGADTLYQSSGVLESVAVVVAGAGIGALWDVYDLQGISRGMGLDASALKALPAGQYWALRRSVGQNLGQRIVVP